MRILLMPGSYAPVIGGLQTAVASLAEGLKKSGHDVRVLTQRYPRVLKRNERVNEIPVYREFFFKSGIEYLKSGRPDLLLASLFLNPKTEGRLERMIQEFNPDVVNVHFAGVLIPFVLKIRAKFKFRFVLSFHGNDIERFFDENPPAVEKEMVMKALKEAGAVTVPSKYLLSRVIQLDASAASKSHAICNGISLEKYLNSRPYRYPQPYILAYGRLIPVKGFDLLIRAFAVISKKNPQMHLILAGEGGEKANLVKLANGLGVSAKILFYGKASSEEIRSLLNGCLFAAVPSRQESFGLSALEAMAAGKFVVAAKVGGLPEILQDTASALVLPEPGAIAEAIEASLQDLEGIKAGGARNRAAAARYGLSVMIQRYERIYQNGS